MTDLLSPPAPSTLTAERVRRALVAYTTRHVPLGELAASLSLETGDDVVPRAGDLVLARVDELGLHRRLESPASRRQTLLPGQEIIVAYGNRYATDQFLARVPSSLQPCHLVAGGGLASLVEQQHAAVDPATTITPIGVLRDATGRLTLDRFAPYTTLPADAYLDLARPPVIAVLGTAMNSGKTTSLAAIINGLTAAGLSVAAGKATGTGAGNDPGLFADFGARTVLDFTDFGHATTFGLDEGTIRDLFVSVVHELAATKPDVVVVEIADGLLHSDTAMLLRDPVFERCIDRLVFAAHDALGATAAVGILAEEGLEVDVITGVLTSAPLAVSEARRTLATPVIATDDLRRPEVALSVLEGRATPAVS